MRDDLQLGQAAGSAPATKNGISSKPSYPPLKAEQHQIIRQHAPKRRAKPVRTSSITDLL